MGDTVRIDLHCHSTVSDGKLNVAAIAMHCAERNVRFAALTDHNSIEGLDTFESACERYGVGFISGLELNVLFGYKDIHLLCYGFDRANSEFRRTLNALKASRANTGSAYAAGPHLGPAEMIDAVHRAGGIVVLAHPLMTEPEAEKRERLIADLFAMGMDGVEVWHPQSDSEQQTALRKLAVRYNGVVSAGTDHHTLEGLAGQPMGVDVPEADWRTFRDRLIRIRKDAPRRTPARRDPESASGDGAGAWRRILLPIGLPALAVIGLFTLALFGFFLPRFEAALLERKRETIRELTRTIWSMLDESEKQVRAGRLDPETARRQAVERVRGLRYGRESLDYFWLQDLTPTMIMHPYRPELEGQDLSDFRDPRGMHIFKMFAEKVLADGSGYVDYVWQWQDDPDRLEAKESYIKLFAPWGWVIGTGMYIDDVTAEILAIETRIYHVMLAITGVLVLLLMVMLRGGLKSERLRLFAERRLRESNARYASLVRAAAEGVLFVRNARCVYANPVFLELAGCDAEELPLLDWRELFPSVTLKPDSFAISTPERAVYTDTLLRRRDGASLACRMALRGMPEQASGSFVVLVRRATDDAGMSPPTDDSLLKRLLNLPSTAAEDIAREIEQATSAETVVSLCQRTPALVRAMLESGAAPVGVAGMITAITDAATRQFIRLFESDLGPSPVPYAFVVVGSQGRGEQTLYTDQDNILIFDGDAKSSESDLNDYVAKLAEYVCMWLEKAGYRACEGQLMANNSKWRQPLSVWRERFSHWIRKAEGHEAMDFMTLFDLRCVYGNAEFVHALRAHIHREIEQSPWFFTQAARNAIQFKTPLRIFGSIVTAGRATDKSGHLDLKALMMPIVCYARLYALKHQIVRTGTSDRISDLRDQGTLLPSRAHDILTAFDTLMRLRLRHQVESERRQGDPDNLIELAALGHIDEAVLKECFSEIDRIQQGIVREFLGGESGVH